MNRVHLIVKHLSVLCLLISTQVLWADTTLDADIQNRVENLNSSVDIRYTAEVKNRINQYTVRQREASSTILGRVNIYFPLFEKVLRERQLPEDLKYLAVIESGLNPNALSKAGAAGLWQFMKPTARMQGLKVSKYIDERRDPVESTYAAADYLEYLYGKFDDWTLALAAYNCGPGNVRKAIRRSGGKTTYWEIQRYLPKETRKYIPKFIAMSYMLNYYYEHDLYPTMPKQELIHTLKAKIYDKVSLKKLSKEIGVDYATLKWLNAKYVRGYIPSSKKEAHTIILPHNAMYAMMDNYRMELTDLPQPAIVEVVEKKEEVRVLVPRTKVHVPHLNKTWYTFDEEKHLLKLEKRQRISGIGTYRYRVIGRKQSLKDIAAEEKVDIDDLLALNNYGPTQLPKLGDVIKVKALN